MIKAAVADFFNWTSLSVNIVYDNLTAWERLRRVPTCQVWKATGIRKPTAISSSRKAKLSNRTQSRRKMPKPGIRTKNSETEWSLLKRNTEMMSMKSAFGEKRNQQYVPANVPVANNTNIRDLISRCRSEMRLEMIWLENCFCSQPLLFVQGRTKGQLTISINSNWFEWQPEKSWPIRV